MKRSLFGITALLSLVLCIATLTLWTRSYTHFRGGEVFTFYHGTKNYQLNSTQGWIMFLASSQPRLIPSSALPPTTLRRGTVRVPVYAVNSLILESIPHFVLAGLTLILPISFTIHMMRYRRRRRRETSNLCPTCGYDRRAHNADDRCPECGMVPSPAR